MGIPGEEHSLLPFLPQREPLLFLMEGHLKKKRKEKVKICVNIIDFASSDLKIMISKLFPEKANSLPPPALLPSAQRVAVEVFYFVNEGH